MFKRALDKLPFPFNKEEPWHVSFYENFFATFGTHYVDRVVLGGKRIFTTELTSKATAELVKDSVDIANTLSVEMQVSSLLMSFIYVSTPNQLMRNVSKQCLVHHLSNGVSLVK